MRTLFCPDLIELVTDLTLCFLAAKVKRETGSVSDFKALRIEVNQNLTSCKIFPITHNKKMLSEVMDVVLYNMINKILYFIFSYFIFYFPLCMMSPQHSPDLMIIIGL